MQRCNLRDIYSFILFHDKIAIQENITYLLNISFIFLTGQLFIEYSLFYLVTLSNRVDDLKLLTNGIR
jgi:hypothetical protein